MYEIRSDRRKKGRKKKKLLKINAEEKENKRSDGDFSPLQTRAILWKINPKKKTAADLREADLTPFLMTIGLQLAEFTVEHGPDRA